MNDKINPAHYKQGKVECIEGIESALSREEFIGYLRGNVLKYTWRCRYKGGKEDIAKAVWYSNKLIEVLNKGE